MKMKMDTKESKKKIIKELHEAIVQSDINSEIAEQVIEALEDSLLREKELYAIMDSSRAVLEAKSFIGAAKAIFNHCRDVIGATSGYVALLNENGAENEVLFLESGGLPCDVNPKLPMPIRGLRAEAYQFNKAVYHNDFMNSQWFGFMPKGHVILKNVMFAPLVLNGKTVGIIGLANKETNFDDNDAKMATGFGELAAIALQNSRNLEQRKEAEKQREKVIEDLKTALSEVKRLSGLLPICMHCKKVRDDQGYWNQIEAYIQQHSDAQFSHSICKECAEKYYPEFEIYNSDDP
ncbi:MAG: GAF domain-containing protein [Bacteroidales bacterium]